MKEIQIAMLEGELDLLTEELQQTRALVEYFAAEQDFWRRKYIRDHPEHDHWEYVESARDIEDADAR